MRSFISTGLKTVTIPANVESIGAGAFSGCTSLTSISAASGNQYYKSAGGVLFNKSGTELVQYPGGKSGAYKIPDSVTSIGNTAFGYCGNLTGVTIPSGVKRIGASAFFQCSCLTDVAIPAGVTSIGEFAFSECGNLISASLPGSVTSFGGSLFQRCGSLTSVTIAAGLTRIAGYTFCECSSLTGVTLPDSLTIIGDYAFYRCGSLTEIAIPANVASIGNSAFRESGLTGGITLPDTVTSISDYTFSRCRSLTGVTLPARLTQIGGNAFSDCSKLSSVAIPGSVTNIAGFAFYDCAALTLDVTSGSVGLQYAENNSIPYRLMGDLNSGVHWTLDSDGRLTFTGSGEISFAAAPWSLEDIKTVEIGSGVTAIGASAFNSCMNLEEISIPSGVTSIGNSAFQACVSLETITLPEGLVSIGNSAFSLCEQLKSISLPSAVTSIGSGVFTDCIRLETAVLPAGLQRIDGLFQGCSSLSSVTLPASLQTVGANCFRGCESLTGIDLPAGVTRIEGYAFYQCAITGIDLPEGLTFIGRSAFEKSGLTRIVIPDTVTSMGDGSAYASCFAGCKSLTYARCSAGMSSVEGYLFDGCTSLAAVLIPEDVATISNYAFKGCTGLTLTMPRSLIGMGEYALWNASVHIRAYDGSWAAANLIPSRYTAVKSCAIIGGLRSVSVDNAQINEGESALFTAVSEQEADLLYLYQGDELLASWDAETDSTLENGRRTWQVSYPFEDAGEYSLHMKTGMDGAPLTSSLALETITVSHIPVEDAELPATCTEPGYTAGTHCSRCETILSGHEEIAALGHDPVEDAEMPATCTEPGYMAGTHCSRCETILSGHEEIEALGHDPVEDAKMPATCTEPGYMAGTHCSRCETILSGHEEIEALGHDPVEDPADAATCTTHGMTQGWHCGRCNEILIAREIVYPQGHDPIEDAAVAATCTEPGHTAGTHCSRCDEVLSGHEEIPALGHDWSETIYGWAEDNTSVTATRICNRDGSHVEAERATATARVTREATCVLMGVTTYTSSAFRNEAFEIQTKSVENIEALGHDTIEDAAVAATCTEPGHTAGTHCSRCSEVLSGHEEIAALGHDWGETEYAWRADWTAVTAKRVCGRDETHIETEQAAVIWSVTAPTVDADGQVIYTAVFENADFGEQTKQIGLPALERMDCLTLPTGLTAIPEEAFSGLACQMAVIPDGCAAIGAAAFANCPNLVYVIIPDSVTDIAEDAFAGFLVICAAQGSAAHQYALDNGFLWTAK